ncbi:hypothetical protein ES708_24667 [subsurface metagenome]
MPDRLNRDSHQGESGRAEPENGFLDYMHPRQGVVDDAVEVIVHPAPGQGHAHSRQEKGKDNNRPNDPSAEELCVENQCEGHSQYDLQ